MPSDSTVFVDTNVFLYAFDERDLAKQTLAREWLKVCWLSNIGRISTQVLNEFYHNAITKFRSTITVHQARKQIRDLRQWQPPHLDTYTVDGAWALQDQYHLSYWDALIISSAQQQGCGYLLSEDLQHQQRFDNVQIINPFLTSAADLGLSP
jgi:predicted nucleic acid-binding protein